MEEKKETYADWSLAEVSIELSRLRAELDAATAEKTRLQKMYDYLSIDVIPDMMEEEQVQTAKFDGVGRLQTKADIRCNVLAANRELLKVWLSENGHGDIISPTVNSSSLKALIKDLMKQGKEVPSDIVTITPYSRASVVKA